MFIKLTDEHSQETHHVNTSEIKRIESFKGAGGYVFFKNSEKSISINQADYDSLLRFLNRDGKIVKEIDV